MELYELHIDAVDGLSSFGIICPDKAAVLAFLRKYDHEGSEVILWVWADEFAKDHTEYLNEHAYRYLEPTSADIERLDSDAG